MKYKNTDTVKLDFSHLDTIPEGDYVAVIRNVKLKKSKRKDSKYLCWHLQIAEEPFAGRKLFLITSLSSSSLWRLKKLLKAIDYPYTSGTVDLDLEELVNRKLRVRVKHETYLGKLYTAVADFEPVTESLSY